MELKEYRRLRGLSRASFGRLVGVTGMQVWRWETGRSMPKPPVVDAIRSGTGGAVTAEDHQRAVIGRRASA
ncbi:MAG: putative antitoxin of bacterial toxin-antitoxin system, YdaS/YdaT [Pseudomonadota bacterium]